MTSEKEMTSQREIIKQCDLLVEARNYLVDNADRLIYDTESIERTLKLFSEYSFNLTETQIKELTELREELEELGFSYYWYAKAYHKKFEDLWNANKPFIFT